jgi:N-acyl homoserine lactone hydrolase
MPPKVEILAFLCGQIETEKDKLVQIKNQREAGMHYTIPIPFFVIRHGSSLVAFDTGINKKCATDAKSHWGEEILSVPIVPVLTEEDAFEAQLKSKLRIEPKDLNGLILSHGHLDHAGGLWTLADTEVPIFVQKAELEVIEQGALGYIPGDYPPPERLHWVPVDGVWDVFGDNTVIAFPMPGHTPGLQSLMVTTDEGTYFLTSDALDSIEQLNERLLPWAVWDESKVIQVLNTLDLFRLMGIEVVPMHDPFYWKNRPLAPEPFA